MSEVAPVRKPYKFLSWRDIDRAVTKCARSVSWHGDWRGIIAIARGGLVPATMLAHRLRIETIVSVQLKSYNGQERVPLSLSSIPPHVPDEGYNWLLVDDISDTGATKDYAYSLYPRAQFMTLYNASDHWLVFPWEAGPFHV